MSALTPVAPKLASLIRLLSSDRDGEVVAAARAIGRVLTGSGLDWHALADALTTPPSVVHVERPAPPAVQPEAMVRALRHRCVVLRPKERAFVDDLAGRLWRAGRLSLTPRQRDWLAAIYARSAGASG